jgi:hypothetical protein
MLSTPRNGAPGRALPCNSDAVGGALTGASFQERARKRSAAVHVLLGDGVPASSSGHGLLYGGAPASSV